MVKHLSGNLLVGCVLMGLVVVAAGAARDSSLSSWAELDAAAQALAEGQLDVASQAFEALSQNASAPSFVRGLALLGLAQAALARQDFTAAAATWQRLAADTGMPRVHRDTAARRISEMKRPEEGSRRRDPAARRTTLSVLPEPAVVFHVAPAGNDAGDGSAGKPFRTLERARDAVRALKRSAGGALPRGGVRVMVGGGAYPAERTLVLASEDSGTAEAPVVYQAEPGQTPILHGGVRITGWRPISDTALRDKLDPTVRSRVLEADLKVLGRRIGVTRHPCAGGRSCLSTARRRHSRGGRMKASSRPARSWARRLSKSGVV